MATATAKARKAHNLDEGMEMLEILVAYDFRVVQYSDYHFRVNEQLNIYPSTKTWHDAKSNAKGHYLDLVPFVRDYFNL